MVNGSPTKTQMVDSAGGRTQLSQTTMALVVAIVLLFLTGPLSYMPKAVLASVVFLIGIELVDIAGMKKVFKLRRDEFFVAALTAAVVVLVGVEQGIVIAIVASIIDHIRRSYRPPTAVLEPEAKGRGFVAATTAPAARTEDGLVVYRFAGRRSTTPTPRGSARRSWPSCTTRRPGRCGGSASTSRRCPTSTTPAPRRSSSSTPS